MKLFMGIVAYAIVIKLLITALKEGNLMYTNAMWDGVSSVIGVVLAYFLLGERMSGWMQWLGLILTVVGVVILNCGKIPY
jgi:multidrug transporter EmrE-like cation transporter